MTSEQLKQFLIHFNINREDLSKLLEVSPQAVHHWVHGDRPIPKTTARLLRFFCAYPQALDAFKAV